eukprot:759683-Hanusia_phi.AAC.10
MGVQTPLLLLALLACWWSITWAYPCQKISIEGFSTHTNWNGQYSIKNVSLCPSCSAWYHMTDNLVVFRGSNSDWFLASAPLQSLLVQNNTILGMNIRGGGEIDGEQVGSSASLPPGRGWSITALDHGQGFTVDLTVDCTCSSSTCVLGNGSLMMVIVGVLSFCVLAVMCVCWGHQVYRRRARSLLMHEAVASEEVAAPYPGFVVPVSFETKRRAEIILETLRQVPKGRIHLAQASYTLTPKTLNVHVDWEHGDINVLIPNHSGVSEYLDSTVASYISQRSQLSSADLCVLCFDHKRDLQLRPCQHNVFCVQCISQLLCRWQKKEGLLCPVCRTPFRSLVYTDPAKPQDKMENKEEEQETAIEVRAVAAGDDSMTAEGASLVYKTIGDESMSDPAGGMQELGVEEEEEGNIGTKPEG